MSWRELRAAWRAGNVLRLEVLVLRAAGYRALAPLKRRLRQCGVDALYLLQSEAHDEITARPALPQGHARLRLPL
ncbi:hypothetical protein ACIGKL_19405 [Pseudomonas sp. NPDC077186]|uniref:hypothetical protein n=1 Tax=Pseudomonas sp. NPDC077186 TaxID=3364421 RepID=UPI0037CBDC1C